MTASTSHRSLLLAARELLIDIERTDFTTLANHSGAAAGSPSAKQPLPPPPRGKDGSAQKDEHKEMLLQQVDQYRDSLVEQQQAWLAGHGSRNFKSAAFPA